MSKTKNQAKKQAKTASAVKARTGDERGGTGRQADG